MKQEVGGEEKEKREAAFRCPQKFPAGYVIGTPPRLPRCRTFKSESGRNLHSPQYGCPRPPHFINTE